ncbi:MAG TPA: glutathione S-transferase family protein [Xanthobacteraceae bacterium]|nr:glutathione S-transferase family protein [Xanthobacteraceae bacterium]
MAVPKTGSRSKSRSGTAAPAAEVVPEVVADTAKKAPAPRRPKAAAKAAAAPAASLTLSSKNYSSWSLRGWLLCRFAGLAFTEERLSADDPTIRAELLLQSSSFLVPCLSHDGMKIWDTLAIAEYLHELAPEAGLLPKDKAARAHCRSICGEMHSGFANLRSALPMNLKAHHPGFKVWTGARADIAHILGIWRLCFSTYGGPFLFGERSMADAMYAPVCARFTTYDVALDPDSAAYCRRILALPDMAEWIAAAKEEPEEMEELDVEF